MRSFHEIKRTSAAGAEKMIRYEYFKVRIPEELRERVEETYEWRDIDKMLADPQISSRNADLLMDIKTCFYEDVSDSFFNNNKASPIKIIWNITQKCEFDCDICATHRDDRKELSIDQKDRILLNILSIGKDRIRGIDFSGGDPLIDQENWDIIFSAQQILGTEKVCVTTTGKGIEKLAKERRDILPKILTNCEITVDEIEEIPSTIRNQEGYAFGNRITTENHSNAIGNLTVNVPILDDRMSDSNIARLVEKIAGIQANSITCALLRLMPSGKMSAYSKYPNNYDPTHYIEVFMREASKYSNLHIHIHCALQCFLSNGNHCNMLTKKIGIDNQGNVFACAWGGYINSIKEIRKNPFYLGNCYVQGLNTILDDKKARQMKEKIEKGTSCCRLFNYHEATTDHNIYKDHDPAMRIRRQQKC